MLSEAEKRVASLAVMRYGADRARVRLVCQSLVEAKANGSVRDLVQSLVGQKLLTPAQGQELRLSLDTTQLDPAAVQAGSRPPSTVDDPVAAQDAVDVLSPGSVYDLRNVGEFRILRPLGEGGMGSVYLGYHEGQRRHVAIKILPDHLAANQSYVDRFYREARSGVLLDHPNIVRTILVGQDRPSGKHYLVLDYVDGLSAHALLNRFGKLTIGDAVHIAVDIARALEHAHSRNIVHRDIKPDNILLTQSGVAKLSDLGLSKRTDEASHLTAARQGFGTPYYMPYEQALNAKYADGRCDIFALGATLYHLVTGQLPFPGTTHIEILDRKERGQFPSARLLNPAVPPSLDRVLNKMLARDPDDRYQTASELIVDLERSNLATPVPSFVDPDMALQDPLVRARLISPAQPTRPDLEGIAADRPGKNGNPNVWYVRYRKQDGRWCKARASTQQIVQRLREGRLAGTVEAAREPNGDFRALARYPEFRPTARALAKRKKKTRSSGRLPALNTAAKDAVAKNVVRAASHWPSLALVGAGLAIIVAGALVVRWLI